MMAWPWLAVAVKTIPWATLLRRAPDIIDAASNLLASRKTNKAAVHAAAKTESQLGELQERLAGLEAHDRETAEVVNQIAEQTQELTNVLRAVAAKVKLLQILLVATAVIAIVAVGIASL